MAEPREVTVPPAKRERKAGDWKSDVKWAAALLLIAILGLAGWNNEAWMSTPEGREDLGRVADLILGESELVFLLQLVGVLLVAALVAALVLAIRDPDAPGGVA